MKKMESEMTMSKSVNSSKGSKVTPSKIGLKRVIGPHRVELTKNDLDEIQTT